MLVESLMDKNLKYSKDRTSKFKSKKVKEARWEYTLKCGKSLRDAIEAEDYLTILQTLGDAYMELYLADLIDEDECDEWREEVTNLMDDLDEDEIDDEIDFQLDQFYDLCDNLRVWIPLTESKRLKKLRVVKESIDWHDFDKFDPLLDQYMPPRGEGETLASQAATAVNKLVYKWYNDGDVFDNTYYLEGWANDLSSYANWLYNHVSRAQRVLDSISECRSDSDYEELLYNLAGLVLQPDFLQDLSTQPKIGSIYKCTGPFKFVQYKDEDDEDWDEESLHKGKKPRVIKESDSQRYRYFNTKFRSLKDKLSEFLKQSNIYYELSGQIADWHFAILCNEDEEKRINDWLDENNIWSAPLQSKEY